MLTKKTNNRSTLSRTLLIIVGILVAILLTLNSGFISTAEIDSSKIMGETSSEKLLGNKISTVASGSKKAFNLTEKFVNYIHNARK